MTDDSDIYENMGHAAYGFFKSFLKEKKNQLSSFFVRHKVGFLPQGVDYSIFQKLSRKTAFKQLKFLIGEHKTLPIVMTGLWINSLNEEDQVKVVEDNRNEVYQKFGEEGVNILNMGTTGFMEGFIRFLTNYNIRKNPAKEEIIDIYELNLKEWSRITIFVKKNSLMNHIIYKFKNKVNQGMKFIYVFASYTAIKIAKDAIDQLDKEGILKEENYDFCVEKLNPEGSRRVWIFEKQDVL